jgi:hypothetical protein
MMSQQGNLTIKNRKRLDIIIPSFPRITADIRLSIWSPVLKRKIMGDNDRGFHIS